MIKNKNTPLFSLTMSMFIFGTIGIFVRFLPFASSFTAMCRGYTGFLFVALFMLVTGKKVNFRAIRKNLFLLCASGIFIGFNWILLFEAYKYTSVAKATLCYYMQPVFVMLLSPIVLKEKLTAKKLLCVLSGLLGMVFISGVTQGSGLNRAELPGLIFGVSAALLYASDILMNKCLKDIGQYEITSVQLFVAALSVTPYTFMTGGCDNLEFTAVSLIILIILGTVHTGLAYTLHFSSLPYLKAQTIAIFSYVDPVVAIILSAIIFKERMGIDGFIGAVLILGAAFISEFSTSKKR
jgi:RarD protein